MSTPPPTSMSAAALSAGRPAAVKVLRAAPMETHARPARSCSTSPESRRRRRGCPRPAARGGRQDGPAQCRSGGRRSGYAGVGRKLTAFPSPDPLMRALTEYAVVYLLDSSYCYPHRRALPEGVFDLTSACFTGPGASPSTRTARSAPTATRLSASARNPTIRRPSTSRIRSGSRGVSFSSSGGYQIPQYLIVGIFNGGWGFSRWGWGEWGGGQRRLEWPFMGGGVIGVLVLFAAIAFSSGPLPAGHVRLRDRHEPLDVPRLGLRIADARRVPTLPAGPFTRADQKPKAISHPPGGRGQTRRLMNT